MSRFAMREGSNSGYMRIGCDNEVIRPANGVDVVDPPIPGAAIDHGLQSVQHFQGNRSVATPLT
jgi:hypothetical protein